MNASHAYRTLCSIGLLGLIVGSTGCTTTPLINRVFMLDPVPEANAAPADPNAPTISVILTPKKGKGRRAKFPYREGMLVSEALEESNALTHFRREHVELLRHTPPKGQLVRMKVDYDRAGDRISPSTDFALHPGDMIEVVQDTTTIVDDVIGDTIGPVGKSYLLHSLTGSKLN